MLVKLSISGNIHKLLYPFFTVLWPSPHLWWCFGNDFFTRTEFLMVFSIYLPTLGNEICEQPPIKKLSTVEVITRTEPIHKWHHQNFPILSSFQSLSLVRANMFYLEDLKDQHLMPHFVIVGNLSLNSNIKFSNSIQSVCIIEEHA